MYTQKVDTKDTISSSQPMHYGKQDNTDFTFGLIQHIQENKSLCVWYMPQKMENVQHDTSVQIINHHIYKPSESLWNKLTF